MFAAVATGWRDVLDVVDEPTSFRFAPHLLLGCKPLRRPIRVTKPMSDSHVALVANDIRGCAGQQDALHRAATGVCADSRFFTVVFVREGDTLHAECRSVLMLEDVYFSMPA